MQVLAAVEVGAGHREAGNGLSLASPALGAEAVVERAVHRHPRMSWCGGVVGVNKLHLERGGRMLITWV